MYFEVTHEERRYSEEQRKHLFKNKIKEHQHQEKECGLSPVPEEIWFLILIKEVEISLTPLSQEFSEGKNNFCLKNEDSGITEGGKKSQILKVNFPQNNFAPYSQISKSLNTSAVKTYIYGRMQNGALYFYILI